MPAHSAEPLPDTLPPNATLSLSEPLLTATDVSLLFGIPRSSVHDYAKRPLTRRRRMSQARGQQLAPERPAKACRERTSPMVKAAVTTCAYLIAGRASPLEPRRPLAPASAELEVL
jgi:hypothetical protein